MRVGAESEIDMMNLKDAAFFALKKLLDDGVVSSPLCYQNIFKDFDLAFSAVLENPPSSPVVELLGFFPAHNSVVYPEADESFNSPIYKVD